MRQICCPSPRKSSSVCSGRNGDCDCGGESVTGTATCWCTSAHTRPNSLNQLMLR